MKFRKTKSDSKKVQPRPRVKPLWKDGRTLGLVAVVAVVTLGGAGWHLWKSGWVGDASQELRWKVIAASADMGFKVEDVLVMGRRETARNALLNAVHLARGAPILAFDPAAAQRRIEALPWVRVASVQRRLPDTVFVRIVERRPLALWQNGRHLALIDYDGHVIVDRDLGRFHNLLLVVGADAPAHAAHLLEMLWNQPELMARVKSAVRVGGRRWNVQFDNGIEARLPERNPAAAWARLADYERTHDVLGKDIGVLDLRMPDRLIVQKTKSTEPKDSGTET